jgi:CheY-like chemotaxis protein
MTADNDPSLASAGTVLVVEGEVLLRLIISEYLRDCGYQSHRGDQCRRGVQQPQLAVDVIFSDIEMPGSMDGLGLAQWARSNRPGLDVILTGSVPRAVNAGADLCESSGTVQKPYEPQVAHDRIRRLLAARSPDRKG